MKNSKKYIIFIGIILFVLLVGIVYFLCFYRGTTQEDINDLTIIEKVTLNEDEKEILAELQRLSYSLSNPQSQENSNTNTTENFNMAPTEPMELTKFCQKLYEARKLISDNGEISYLFDMDTQLGDSEAVRRIIVTQNGKITYFTLTDKDYDVNQFKNTTVESNGDGLTVNFGNEFQKAIFMQITQSVQDMWNKSLTFGDVNYDKIFNQI